MSTALLLLGPMQVASNAPSVDSKVINRTVLATWRAALGTFGTPILRQTPPPISCLKWISHTRAQTNLKPFSGLAFPSCGTITKKAFVWYALVSDGYVPITTSRAIPGLPLVEVANRVAVARPGKTKALIAEWRRWLQTNAHLHEAAKAAS